MDWRDEIMQLAAECMDAVELPYQRVEGGPFLIVDQFGHGITVSPFRAAPLVEEAGPEYGINVSLALLGDVAMEDPRHWQSLARANQESAWVRWSWNANANVIEVNMDLFAGDLSPTLLLRAVQALSNAARDHGDLMAEWIPGRRLFAGPRAGAS